MIKRLGYAQGAMEMIFSYDFLEIEGFNRDQVYEPSSRRQAST
jgi:hypothetical protein